jgi:hypothetical protein
MPIRKRFARLFAGPCMLATIPALALSVSTVASGAQQRPVVQTEQAQISGTITDREVTDLYGAGSYTELIKLQPGTLVGWKDFDPKGTLREDSVIQYGTTAAGTSEKTEETRDYFSDRGILQEKTITDWNLGGGLKSYEFKDFDLHGGLKFDHISKYELNDHIESTWNPRTYGWDSTTMPYKLPVTSGGATTTTTPGANATNYYLPQNQSIGMLVGRDYKFGDTISGSLWKSNYAEGFKTVPGLYEYSFPMQTYTLPDKSLNFAGLELGVKGYGYAPVGSDGRFSLHLPLDYKGSLQFQVRQDDVPAGSAGSAAQFGIDPPVAGLAMPKNLVSPQDVDLATEMEMEYLIHLWNYAYDLELEWDEADFWGASDAYMDDLDWEMGDVYEEIDYVAGHLPKDLVVQAAHEMADETRATNTAIRSFAGDSLTTDDRAELDEYDGWAEFLDNEAQERKYMGLAVALQNWPGYWDSPVVSQGRLGDVHGPFSGDCYDNQVLLDGLRYLPLTETPNSFYFMPPDGLTAGLHNFQIGGYGSPQTTLPVFYMTLTMWADQTNLHKGQSTTYHLKLDGLNGLPGSAWNSSFYSSDLMSPSELQGGVPDSSRKGTITLTITNQTPGVITMKNVYAELDAQSFVPHGSFQFDGGVGAIMDGGFGIVGIARAFLQPQWAWGSAFPDSLTSPTIPSLGQTYGLTPSWLGPSSIAPTGLPACSFGNGCLDYDPLRIYRQFSVAPYSASSATSTENSTMPTRDQVQSSVSGAQQAVKDWTQRCKDANKKASAAWAAGAATVPQSSIDALTKAGQVQDAAGKAERAARNANLANPTAANQAAYQSAMTASANAREDYETARNAVESQFSPALRTAFQAADGDAKTADYYRARAEEELRDAHNTAGQLKPMLNIKYMF